MASRSSRQRSAARAAAERDLLRSLLRHGARFRSPSPELVAHAEKLAQLGLISLQRLRTVRCAAPLDGDFPPPLATCDGLIDLRPEADEGGGAYRCQICDRIVYPEAEQKQQFESLVIHHRQAGIEAFLIERCGDLAVGKAFAAGVLSLPVGGMNAAICLVDYCTDEPWLGRGFGVSQRCVYVTAGPDVAPRLLWEDAIAHVELVDVLIGAKDLAAIIIGRATTSPAALAYIDPLVYSLGARPIAQGPQEQAEPRRVFHLCLSPEGLLVEGLLAVRAQRRATAMAIMQVLMKTYAEAAASGRTVEPMTPDTLANAVEPLIGTVEDADRIARQIPRIRKSIMDTVRQHTGKPIGEHDVIETVSRSGANEDAEGYRLNPRSVALGPLQP